jgi:hypothetical protein
MTFERGTDRDGALRDILVAKAAAEGRPRPHRPRSWALGIGAFAIAGALAGAAITTTAIASADQANKVFRLGVSAEQQVKGLGGLVGAPVVQDATGTAHLALGRPPAGATRVVVAFECFDDRSVVASVGGDSETTGCTINAPRVLELSAPIGPPQTVALKTAAGSRILAWGSWMRDRPVPSPSAQQKVDLSDGHVTHQEYLAAYSRYAGCMAEAGYPMAPVYGAPPFVFYAVPSAAVDTGADSTCYAREFGKVDTAWQSTLSSINVACLAAHGIDGNRMPLEEQLTQLHQIGMSLQSCSPEQR